MDTLMKGCDSPLAFGITREELTSWKEAVNRGEIAYLTHFWFDPRFPQYTSVTKVGCANIERLIQWCEKHELNPDYIHHRKRFPHFDLIGPKQREILLSEGLTQHLHRFHLLAPHQE